MNPEGLLLRGSLMGVCNNYCRLRRNRRSNHLGAVVRAQRLLRQAFKIKSAKTIKDEARRIEAFFSPFPIVSRRAIAPVPLNSQLSN
jgi:hypothetical protein